MNWKFFKIYVTFLCSIALYFNANAQSSIFLGGNGSGGDVSSYSQIDATLNNNIFTGGYASGFIVSSIGIIEEVPLPITLLYFEAFVKDKERKVELKWATASEANNDFFTIERSRNGLEWEKVTTVKGAGFSSTLLTYSAIDMVPYRGISYYRLKQTDFNGKYAYSKIKAVSIDTEHIVKLYPNPTNDKFYIIKSDETDYSVTIIDICGKTVFKGNNCKEISTQNLSGGMYIVHLNFTCEETLSVKLIVNK